MVSTIFRVDADHMERLFPATAFDPVTGIVIEHMIQVVSEGICDGNPYITIQDVTATLLDTIPSVCGSKDPRVLLSNIRRWALDGLRELPRIEGHLVPLERPTNLLPDHKIQTTTRKIPATVARSILANAFLGNCLDPMSKFKDSFNRGGLDFIEFYRRTNRNKVGPQKLACLLSYFQTCARLEVWPDDQHEIFFDRIRFQPSFSLEAAGASKVIGHRYVGEGLHLHRNTMESSAMCDSFVNFANSNFGYGKFVNSCTQEEILQMCCPEFNVGMLFIGKIPPDEVVIVRGARRFTQYSGYQNSFRYEGPTSTDWRIPRGVRRRVQSISVMDACFKDHFQLDMVVRDTDKALAAFSAQALSLGREGADTHSRPTVATGKWGCGAFGGLTPHKLLQQAMAATLAGVDLEFSCRGGMDNCDRLVQGLHTHQPSPSTVANFLKTRAGKIYSGSDAFVQDALAFLAKPDVSEGVRGWFFE